MRRSPRAVLWACLVGTALTGIAGCNPSASSAAHTSPAPSPPPEASVLAPPEVGHSVTAPAPAPRGLAASAGAMGSAAVHNVVGGVAGATSTVGNWLWYAGASVGSALGQGAKASADQVYAAGNAAWSGGAALVGAVEHGTQASLNALETARTTAKQLAWEISFALGINETAATALSGDPTSASLDTPQETPPKPRAFATATPALAAPDQTSAMDAKPPQAAAPPLPPAPLPSVLKPVVEESLEPVNRAEVLAPLLIDQPRREADGSFFIPKAVQRLLDVRTQKVMAGDHPVRIMLPARVIPDPNAEGHVEASVMGRLETTERGLPILGQKVSKGDILAYVVPAIGVVDRTQIRRDVARLTTEIRAAAENLDILQKFSFVPFRDGKIVQARMHLDGLRRERAALLPLLDTREALRAPTDGVVSSIEVVTGQVLQPGQIAFQIVNPGHLWIEASAADPGVAAEAAVAQGADAVTPEGEMLNIRFAGTGLSMQQQAALLNYAIENPPEGLRVGRPVTVFATRRNQHHRGVAVPHEGVVNGPSGMDEVWERIDPEHFRPRPVHAEPLDGHTMLVVNGLNDGAQVVVHSARLLAQYQ